MQEGHAPSCPPQPHPRAPDPAGSCHSPAPVHLTAFSNSVYVTCHIQHADRMRERNRGLYALASQQVVQSGCQGTQLTEATKHKVLAQCLFVAGRHCTSPQSASSQCEKAQSKLPCSNCNESTKWGVGRWTAHGMLGRSPLHGNMQVCHKTLPQSNNSRSICKDTWMTRALVPQA